MLLSSLVLRPLNHNWSRDFAALLAGVQHSLHVASPFVTSSGVKFLRSHLPTDPTHVRACFLTNLSPQNVASGATEPKALESWFAGDWEAQVVHLAGLHAKVYVADRRSAIVTSGNLTSGGLFRNIEYGVLVDDSAIAAVVAADLDAHAELGTPLSSAAIGVLSDAAEALRKLQADVASEARGQRDARRLDEATQQFQDMLVRERLENGTITGTFERTILYLLRRHGPLETADLHPRVKAIHPDLCDDAVDRVINGQRFGKKWKHAVRSAQQHLKSAGVIRLSGGHWQLSDT